MTIFPDILPSRENIYSNISIKDTFNNKLECQKHGYKGEGGIEMALWGFLS